MSDRKSFGSSPQLRKPGSSRPKPARGLFGLLLCLLCPPLGLIFLWRIGVFRIRGRMLLTVLATIEMALFVVLLTPKAELDSIAPVPGAPVRATPAPESQVLTALSNMDELLYQQQLEEIRAQGGDESDLLSTEEKQAQLNAKLEEIYATEVYSVNSGAIYYHAAQVCGNQSNRRALTVREAISAGLGACSDCNPPSPADVNIPAETPAE